MFPPPIEVIVVPNLLVYTLVSYHFIVNWRDLVCPPRAQGNSYVKINLATLQHLGNLIKCLQGSGCRQGGWGDFVQLPLHVIIRANMCPSQVAAVVPMCEHVICPPPLCNMVIIWFFVSGVLIRLFG